ncbi:hypothetical protein ACLB2K_071295 [Fragaria x ananassa]
MNCKSLKVVNLENNNLSGNIPSSIGYLLDLISVHLRNNQLSGELPLSLQNCTQCFNNLSAMNNLSKSSSLTFLDVTNEGIVSSFGVVRYEIYEDNAIVVTKGKEVQYSKILRLVRIMDISDNIISGEIFEELTSLEALQTLNLSNNLLTGEIPSKIGHLSRLETLDLSKNHLVGVIPASMRSMTFLNHLNLQQSERTHSRKHSASEL